MKSRLQILSLSLYIYIISVCIVREMSCAMRSSLDFLTSSFTAKTYGWEGGLQNSFAGAEQPRMIELLVYSTRCPKGTRSPRTSCQGGQLVLGPHVRGDISTGGHPVL